MRATSGATPLIAVEAVAFDSETTGLDTRKARIVQLGAVGIARSAVVPDDRFDTLVRPDVPIRPESTSIHGITDATVASAPDYPAAWRAFETFRNDRLVVGYATGFDLAVMEREAERHGLSWKRPRSLCVRTLSLVVDPHLKDHSLEGLTAWLGVSLIDRHSASGDAMAAAEVFVALVPRLRARGIRTLAEAEQASLQLAQEREAQARAGWAAPASPPELPPFAAVDPFAYRHRVGELMSAPPVIVGGGMPLSAAIALMMERRISSLLVGRDGRPGGRVDEYAIVTERDVMRVVVSEGVPGLEQPVADHSSAPLASIRARAFAYRAIGRMDRLKIRHLAVRDESGLLVGMISARDLLRLRAGAAIRLDDTIDAANSPADLAAAWSGLPAVANALVSEEVDARIVAAIVSEELCAMTRRAAMLAERDMAASGLGGAPCRYAVLVLGSAGRGESLLAADQDNAIVFEKGEPDGPEDRWFAALGERIATMLDEAGIVFCRGGVMAKNPQWRGSLEEWRRRIGRWMQRSRPQDLLNVDIFFDLTAVHGERSLGETLLAEAYGHGHAQRPFLLLLGEQLAGLPTPFTLFGRFRTEEGRIDLKRFALFPIVSLARTLSIRHDIRATSTAARMEGLIERQVGSEATLRRLVDVHHLVLRLMFAQQSRDQHAGVAVSNMVEIGALPPTDREALKAGLADVQIVPELLRDLM